jgi:hypothetical protein
MVDIKVTGRDEPEALANLIASLEAEASEDATPSTAEVAELVKLEQAQAERNRPSHQDLATVDYARLDPESDWTDV